MLKTCENADFIEIKLFPSIYIAKFSPISLKVTFIDGGYNY